MTDISREQALAHFGVKGMRWGIRHPSFVKVDQATGAFTDFAPWNEPDPVGLEEALLGSEVPDG